MSGDEVRTRLSQAAYKRWDAAAGAFGHGFGARRLDSGAILGRFFFQPDELAERVALLRKFLPLEVARIIEESDAISQHRFDLLGYTSLDYGREIDWHLDAVHGKRAPRKAWPRINFLNFHEVGDHKITWELNRH